MPLLLRNLRLQLDEPAELLVERAAHRLRVSVDAIRTYAVVRRALDARRKDDVHFIYHVEVALNEPPPTERARLKRLRPQDAAWLEPAPTPEPQPGREPLSGRPIVVGFGPAGMLAAWRLATLGYRPLVLERGRDVRRRHRDILQRFYREREFDPASNLLFGEGGAGAYSDGKLYTRVHDPLCRLVLEVLYQHGADPDILTAARPHIGSDRLPTVCRRLRQKIEALGGEVRFDSCATGWHRAAGNQVRLRIGDDQLDAAPTIVAVGHSARDTIQQLRAAGLQVAAKPFQLGVRIEHPQSLIDRWQYGPSAGHPNLTPAEYQLVAKGAAGDDGDLFSFCMCPGGTVLPTNEAPGLVATNGASRARRNGPLGNAGLVITIPPERFDHDPQIGIYLQQHLERRCFAAAGGDYRVPLQRAGDLLAGRPSDGETTTSYPLGGAWVDLPTLLPEEVTAALHRGLPMLDELMPGFAGPDAVILAPETRASAPFRIVRDPATRCAENADNLYPVGEGAGYAGGIVSSAIDGLKSADALIARYAPPGGA